jgi:hypothetical protein
MATFISERNGKVEAETSAGADHLTVVRSGKFLRVTYRDGTQIGGPTDVYTITAETVDFVSAVQGMRTLPAVHSLVINKRMGSAVWTESDSAPVLGSKYPTASSVFLHCVN